MKTMYLLASDMDGTIIPIDNEKRRKEEILEFNVLVDHHRDVSLAYVTGRHLELAVAGVREHGLAVPDVMVCDVGTSTYLKHDDTWVVDEEYRKRLRDSWNGLAREDIASVLRDIPELSSQEDEKQKEFKQSYYAPPEAGGEAVVRKIGKRLESSGIDANIIYSIDPKQKIGLVDVLPPMAAKDYALGYIREKLMIARGNVVYAGDSGNDLRAFKSGFKAVIVNNTPEDVKEEVRAWARENHAESRVYFATHRYVKGVIEGCRHFGLFRE